MNAKAKWLKLGVVGRAHGLRGSFFISARDEVWPPTVNRVRITENPDECEDLVVEQSSWQSGRPVLKCLRIDDRTAAERLTGKPVWCDSSFITVDDQSEFLLSDIKGRIVFDSLGETMGVVEEAYLSPSGTVNLIVFNASKNADVEIPLVGRYIDMEFRRGESSLRMHVPVDTFEEIWNPRGQTP